MTIKTKLFLNVAIVVIAIIVIVISALRSFQTINRNINDLTQKTTPYQLAALNQQRALQAHASSLLNLSSSATEDEYKKAAAAASESFADVDKAYKQIERLKAESSRDDKTIAEITQAITKITGEKLLAQDAAQKAANSIKEKLSEAAKRMNELDASARNLQQKTSKTMVTGVDNLINGNQQLNGFMKIRDGVKDLASFIYRIPITGDKQSVGGLKDNVNDTISEIQHAFDNLRKQDKAVWDMRYEMTEKLNALNEKITGNKGTTFLQLKYLSGADEKLRMDIENITTEGGRDVSLLLPTMEKQITQANTSMKSNTTEMVHNIYAFNNTNSILALSSVLSLASASLFANISNCINARSMNEFDKNIALTVNIFKEIGSSGNKLKNLLTTEQQVNESKILSNALHALALVQENFSGNEGVAEKVKASLKYTEELEKLNNRIKDIAAKHLEQSKLEVSKAGSNQENAIASLNRAGKRTVQWIMGFGILIVIVTLLMSIAIGRSITKPIRGVATGLRESSEKVAASSVELSSASRSLAEGAASQASGIEEAAASLEEIASMTKQTAENAGQTNTMMTETSRVVDEANLAMRELIGSMSEICTASEETAKIIKTIDSIAFQTNMLALNAAVEAARAGEAGSGFAVVADQVKNLALKTSAAAKSIAALIEETVQKIQNGSEILTKTNSAFEKVAQGARKVGELVGEITAAAKEQSQGLSQISQAVAEMDKVVQKTAANADDSASAAEAMTTQSEKLEVFVGELVALVDGHRQG